MAQKIVVPFLTTLVIFYKLTKHIIFSIYYVIKSACLCWYFEIKT